MGAWFLWKSVPLSVLLECLGECCTGPSEAVGVFKRVCGSVFPFLRRGLESRRCKSSFHPKPHVNEQDIYYNVLLEKARHRFLLGSVSHQKEHPSQLETWVCEA